MKISNLQIAPKESKNFILKKNGIILSYLIELDRFAISSSCTRKFHRFWIEHSANCFDKIFFHIFACEQIKDVACHKFIMQKSRDKMKSMIDQ